MRADAFHEVSGAEAATASRPARGGQYVVAATGVIAKRLRGVGAEENSSGSSGSFEEDVVRAVRSRQAQMFGGKAVDEIAGVAERCGDQNRSGGPN